MHRKNIHYSFPNIEVENHTFRLLKYVHGKNSFAEKSKILVGYRSEK